MAISRPSRPVSLVAARWALCCFAISPRSADSFLASMPPPRPCTDARTFELHSDIAGSDADVERNGQQNLMSRSALEEELLEGPHQGFLEMASEEERRMATKRIKLQIKERKKTAQRAAGGGGFGASGKGRVREHVEFAPNKDKGGFGAIVLEEGVARVNGCISTDTAKNLLSYINRQLVESMDEVSQGKAEELSRFADVLGKRKRWDMLLPLEESDEVLQAIHEIFHEGGNGLGGAIEAILGKDARLYELSALISDPGSERQALHPDFPYQDTLPPALTSFVALQDIAPDMGPTTFLPRSSTAEHHQELKDRLWAGHSHQGLLATAPNKLNTLGTADCSLYNPMTLHCGGANRSEDKRRVLFYFSFMNPAVGAESITEGASLRPELKERGLTLQNIKKIVKDWKKVESLA